MTDDTFAVNSPGGQASTRVSDCAPADGARAIEATVAAFEAWRKFTPNERSRLIRRWHTLIMEHAEEIAVLITREMGKPISESRREVQYAGDYVEWYAEEAKRMYGESFVGSGAEKRQYAQRRPVGPVFAITPWNFPAAMVTRKVAPALAAGCAVILKPAEQSPMTALLLARLWQEAGGLPDTFQVLPCSDPSKVSEPMFADARIRKLTFTGSTEVGRMLAERAARTLKRVSLELGGHASFIIFADADISAAVEEVVACKFRNAGQACISANRIYVHEDIADAFAQELASRLGSSSSETRWTNARRSGPLLTIRALARSIDT